MSLCGGTTFGVGVAELRQSVQTLRDNGIHIPLDKAQADLVLLSSALDLLVFPDALAASANEPNVQMSEPASDSTFVPIGA